MPCIYNFKMTRFKMIPQELIFHKTCITAIDSSHKAQRGFPPFSYRRYLFCFVFSFLFLSSILQTSHISHIHLKEQKSVSDILFCLPVDVFYPQTGSSGIIKSPGFPSSYTNKLDTTSVVSLDPTRPQLVTFTFDTFDLELCDDCQCDWLEIDVDPAQRFCGDVLDKKSLTGQ